MHQGIAERGRAPMGGRRHDFRGQGALGLACAARGLTLGDKISWQEQGDGREGRMNGAGGEVSVSVTNTGQRTGDEAFLTPSANTTLFLTLTLTLSRGCFPLSQRRGGHSSVEQGGSCGKATADRVQTLQL